MLNKTHIAIGLFFMLFFLSSVVHVWTYVLVFAVAALFPNLDRFLSLKGFRFFRKTNSSNRNRGFFHSFTFWPLKYSSKGRIKRGGCFENMLFYSFVIADVILVYFLFR